MYTREDIINYHCPKWEELPDIGLYMDQIVSVLDRYLAIFTEDEGSKLVTSTMINNYINIRKKKHPMYCLNDKLEGNTFMNKLAIKIFNSAMEKSYPNKTSFEL